jgi:hypothetical protein
VIFHQFCFLDSDWLLLLEDFGMSDFFLAADWLSSLEDFGMSDFFLAADWPNYFVV